ncbi:hypothetical protein OJ996_23255 [Luteolibacter sp. GHJ8]|uniref:Uncharacterized protein n=1 Tax=Luteolibacter rhizosphaerae TaxID=2989719 RepID=A0ABT3GA81_9BACT|nr:hypothetical protein [Luteolibacter rhizosphaerae]MCW1916524.1 hypothetical protein [Luteolibacter rhizosphaerae]
MKRWLRERSDDECFAFVSACIRFRGYGYEQRALDLATSCIRQPAHALVVLRAGLVDPDAGSIKFWLAFGIKKLGGRKVLAEISALLDAKPSAVDKALYWLPGLLPSTDEASRASCQILRAEAQRRGIIRGPASTCTPDGRVLFHDIDGPPDVGSSPGFHRGSGGL